MAACLAAWPATAQDLAATDSEMDHEAAGKLYVHPELGFQIAVPANARVVEPPEGIDLAVRSRDGYALSVQTGSTNEAVSLPAMLAKLEERYLGTGRPWQQKLESQSDMIAGLPAINALYLGAGSRARVIVARGAERDYILTFVAPAERFEHFQRIFDWMRAGFLPARADRAVNAAKPDGNEGDASGSRDEPRVFSEPALGYTLAVPGGWMVRRPDETTRVFLGVEGSDAHFARISIQNIVPSLTGSEHQASLVVLQDLKAMIAYQAEDVRILAEELFIYDKEGRRIEGRQLLIEFTRDRTTYRQWIIVVPRLEAGMAHIWTFTAPLGTFERFQPTAERVAGTWTVTDMPR